MVQAANKDMSSSLGSFSLTSSIWAVHAYKVYLNEKGLLYFLNPEVHFGWLKDFFLKEWLDLEGGWPYLGWAWSDWKED